jgi:hypothetical protein
MWFWRGKRIEPTSSHKRPLCGMRRMVTAVRNSGGAAENLRIQKKTVLWRQFGHRVYKSRSLANNAGPNDRGYDWATLFMGEINTGTWPSRLGESHKWRRWTMLVSSVRLGSEGGCAGDAGQKLKTTDPTSRQRGRPTSTKPNLTKKIIQKRMG